MRRVKCIYIDPPYNTGNEGWVYNDNVNDPKIKKWLGEVVGKEGEDLTRHDKWLCMMYPRLKLLQKLLADDGAIFISIDDTEISNLRLLMDRCSGANNFVTTVIWHKNYAPKSSAKFFRKTMTILQFMRRTKWHGFQICCRTEEQDKIYKNPDNDPRGAMATGQFIRTKSIQPRIIFDHLSRRASNTWPPCWTILGCVRRKV